MTPKISGIEGVLGGLMAPPTKPRPVANPAPEPTRREERQVVPVPEPQPQPIAKPKGPAEISVTRTRIGRPKGIKDGQTPPKRKITILINAQVADEYDAWSWDAHCNIGALVERALVEYLRRNRSSARPS